jgi:hypothetical protein
MALDTTIPLGVQAPRQPENSLAGLAQVAQIKSASLQNALVTQEIQQRAVQAQQAQYKQGAYLAGQQALRNHTDPQTGLPDFTAASKDLAQQYPDIAAEFAKQADDLALNHAKAQSDTVDATQKMHQHVANSLTPAISSGDPAQITAALSSLSTQGPQFKNITDNAMSQTGGDPAKLKALMDSWNGQAANLANAKSVADANKANADAKLAGAKQVNTEAELPKVQAETAVAIRAQTASQLASAGPQGYAAALAKLPPEQQQGWPAAYDKLAILRAAQTPTQAIADVQKQQELAQGAQKTQAEVSNAATNRGRLEVERQRFGFEAGGGVSPQATAIAHGDLDPQTARVLFRSNPGLIGQVKQVDSKFDEANLDNRYNTLKEFSSSSNTKAGGQVLALNTLIHHADLYQQVAQSLQNGSFVPGNAVYNAVAKAFGSAPPTNAALVGRFMAGETGKVATGGVPAEGEINGILKNLSTSSSPDQIKQAGATLLQIAAGRATPLMEKAQQAHLENVVKVIGPDAQAILTRNGYDPNTLKPVVGGAQLPRGNGQVIDKDTASQFYKAAGGDPDKARKLATDSGWKLQ